VHSEGYINRSSYNLNIIILLSSYPFISLINCPWLLFIIILLSYSLNTLIGFLYIIIAINYWSRDVIREYIKKYEVLIIMLFIVFLIIVFSEGLLFLSFFWVSFHSSCSLNYAQPYSALASISNNGFSEFIYPSLFIVAGGLLALWALLFIQLLLVLLALLGIKDVAGQIRHAWILINVTYRLSESIETETLNQ
jgi:hypothetical protein